MSVWHYQKDGASKGPFSDEQLKTLCDAGVVGSETLVWKTGYPGWKRLADTDFAHVPAATGAPPVTGPATAEAAAEAPLSMWRYFARGVTSRYATFKGRARRKEFWSFTLFSILSLIVLCLIAYGIDVAAGNLPADEEANGPMLLPLVIGIWALAILIPSISVTVRRVHDLGITGWLAILCFLPYLGWMATLVIGLIPGQPQANAYGASPKAA